MPVAFFRAPRGRVKNWKGIYKLYFHCLAVHRIVSPGAEKTARKKIRPANYRTRQPHKLRQRSKIKANYFCFQRGMQFGRDRNNWDGG